jgi:Ca2+-binding RTX toxin-like protein
MGGGGADTLTALGSDNTGNNGTGSAIFAGDSAYLSLTSDLDEWKVQLFESRRGPDGDLNLTGTRGTDAYGRDVIDLGSGHLLAIGGEGDDSIRNGDGSAIVLGDHGEMIFSVSNDHKITTVTNAASTAVDESALLTDIAGHDTIELGQGSLQIVMGGDGNDTVTTQTDGSGTLQAGAVLNDSYFAGDRAELVFDPSAAGAKMTRFTAKSDQASGDGNDSLTTADGDMRAVLGYGADSLTMGRGMATVLGDGGDILANPTSFALNRLTYRAEAEPGRDGNDTIVSGDGDMAAILGGGSDSLVTGNGEVLGLGDWGVLRFDESDVLREVSNTPIESLRAVALAYAGGDQFRLGEGMRHVIMGGAGNDSVTAQVDGVTPRDALSSDQSYFAGDHADLLFDGLQTPGNLITEMLTFTGSDWTGFDGNDSFTTGNGEVRAILGVGSDTLAQGDGLGYVLGDLGTLNQNNPAYILGLIEAAPVPFTFATGEDSWAAGDGEHVAIMGASHDTVRLGNGPAQVLLDHGFTQRDVSNAKLIHTEDETAEGWGNDSLIAGSGWGFVIGGGGNDDIATGRIDQDTLTTLDGRHILIGDAGYVDFDPSLPGEMELVRIEAYLPQISGNDRLWGGAGRDVVIGGGGSDEAHGEIGRDFVAGDFLLIEYEQGLERNVITQRDYYDAGAGDLVTTSYDGDFVFGGTQSNTMGVAASVDIIFETFGRILFEQGRGIEKVERIFNMGIASSLLDDRVQDGQLSLSGDTPEPEETAEAATDNAIPLIAPGDDVQIATFELEGGAMLQDVATSGQANLEETTDVQDASPSGNFSAPQFDLVRVTGDLRKFASAPAAVHVAPAGQVVPAQTGQGEWAPLVSTTRVQTIEEQEEMLNFLEGSVILAASAGSYRQYGNPRSVGSLEQRLRVWTKNGFLLRGDASQNSRL